MKSLHERAIQKYFKWCAVFGCLFVLLWIISCIWIRGLAAVVLLFIVLIANKVIVTGVAKKTLLSVLFDEMDAIEFQKIVNDNRFVSPVLYRISSAISAGDYQTAVNLASKCLKKKLPVGTRFFYLSLWARADFELRDYEGLKDLLDQFEELKKQYPAKKVFQAANSAWSYYRFFLDRNYDACKTICAKRDEEIKSGVRMQAFRKLQNDFLYAVACYENRETDEARKTFEDIVSFAPKMHLCAVSQKYLVAIEQNSQEPFESSHLFPDPDFPLYDPRTAVRIKCGRIIIAVCLLLMIASSVFIVAREQEKRLFQQKLNTALESQYDEYQIMDYFILPRNNRPAASFCIVQDSKGQCDIGFVMTNDKGKTYEFFPVIRDIQQNTRNYVISPVDQQGIIIDVSHKKSTDYDKTIMITLNNKNAYIGFSYSKE